MDKTKILNKIKMEVDKAQSVAVFCHTRPDADTIGAALAFSRAISLYGKNVQVFCDSKTDVRLSFMEGVDNIRDIVDKKYDLYIALDCGDDTRMGLLSDAFSKAKNTINIDHHYLTNNNFANINWVENCSSTSEMVYALIEYMSLPCDDIIKSLIMSGIITDTNSFSNTNTDKNVLVTASNLVDSVDINRLNFLLRRNTPYKRLKLMGRAMSNMRSYSDGKIIIMYVLNKDLIETDNALSATEGFVDQALNVDTAKVAICICQSGENTYKVSMRGKDNTDVCSVCREFGGGGHRVAAGCIISGFFEDVIDKILKACGDILGYERIY